MLALGLMYSGLLWNWNSVIYDWAQQLNHRLPDEDIVIVAIDQTSIDEIGQWPWTRSIHAALIDKLHNAGVAVIGYDVVFAEPSSPAEDTDLATAISGSGRVVLPVVNEQVRAGGQLRELLPFPGAARGVAALGHVDRPIDQDAVARTVYLKAGLGEPHWFSFGLSVLRVAVPDAVRQLPGVARKPVANPSPARWQRDQQLWISYAGPPGHYPRVSFNDVLADRFPSGNLRGKIVLVGATAVGLGDVLSTPVSGNRKPMPGVEVIANEIDTLKNGLGIVPLGAHWGLILCGALVLLFTQLLPRMPARHSLLIMLTGVVITLALTVAGVTLAGRWFPPVATIAGLVSGYFLWSWRRLIVTNIYLNRSLARLNSTPTIVEPLALASDAEDEKFLSRLLATSGENSTEGDDESLGRDQVAKHAAYLSLARKQREGSPLTPPGSSVERMERRIRLVEDATEKIRGMSEFIHQSLSQMTSGIIVADVLGHVTLINPAARKLFDEPGDRDVEGVSLLHYWDQLGFSPRSAAIECLRETLIEGKPVDVEVGGPHDRDLLLRLVPFENGSEVQGVIVDIADITAVRIDEERRREFLSFLSHDLRSPLTSIISAAQLARLEPEEFAGDAFISRLENNARKTLGLADEFLELLRVGGVRTEDFERVELCGVIHQAISTVSDHARQKQIEIGSVCDGPMNAYGHGGLLERMFANLLSNAIKYSPDKATVRVAVERTGRHLRCRVEDTGYGIAKEDLPILFARFQRIQREEHKAEQGSGIGLVFVKSVVAQHQGTITVESEPNKGTRFTITLPADA